MHYAGIDPAIFPAEGDGQSMLDALGAQNLYIPNGTEGFMPRPGDLIFFDDIYTGTYAVRVGIITSVDRELGALTVMEGDSADSVAECRYALDDTTILGYGVLPEALRAEAAAAAEAEKTETPEAETTETETTETETTETKTPETETDETETEEEDTAADIVLPVMADGEEVSSHAEIMADEISPKKLMMKAPMLLGAVEENEIGTQGKINLVELCMDTDGNHVAPTQLSYVNLERGEKLHMEFEYKIPNDKLDDAKRHTPWEYDLSKLIGADKVFSKIDTITNGTLTKGGVPVGTYSISPDGVFSIEPNADYLKTVTGNLNGNFSLTVWVNENASLDSNTKTIEFPGNVDTVLQFKEKLMDHSKSVSTTENGDNVSTSGTDKVQLVEEADGEYYLYYTINMNPRNDLKHLTITDTLSGGQTLDRGSIHFNGAAVPDEALSGVSGTGFTLDAAKILPDGAKAYANYIVTYRAQVDKIALKSNTIDKLVNEATYEWEGKNETDKTEVPPKFEEHLDHSKSVSTTAGGGFVPGGNVEMVNEGTTENPKYYLYYRVTAKPNTKADKLELVDTVGAGQSIVADSIAVTVNGVEQTPSPFTASGQNISGSIENVPANAEVVLTYKVELTKNADYDESVLSGVKHNESKWKWKTAEIPDETTVEPKEPDPVFTVHKSAQLESGNTVAKPGNTITYTVTIDSQGADLSKYPFHDYIANYHFEFDPNSVTVKEDSSNTTVSGTVTPGTKRDGIQNGESYELFTYNFPANKTYSGTYTLTYSIKLTEDTSLAGIRALTNRGEIGKGRDDTTTQVDYGTPELLKKWDSWDLENNAVWWTITVTVPAGETFTNLAVEETNFKGGDNQWYQGEDMTIDWDSAKVWTVSDNKKGTEVTSGFEKSGNSILFPTLSESRIITLKTHLPAGVTFDKKNEYYVTNSARLTVDGEGVTDSTDTKKFEKSVYNFTKSGEFNDVEGTGRPTATWTVKINDEQHELTPDVVPYFYDVIPEGMEFYGDSIHIHVDAKTNNGLGNPVWLSDAFCDPPTGNEIGSINLPEAIRNGGSIEHAPTGLSGMCYTITYQTRITEAKWAEMQETVGKYDFTNSAKVLDKDGNTLKTTKDTVTYEYKDLIDKVSVGSKSGSDADAGSDIDTIKYRIAVNPDSKRLNDGKKLELYDILSTSVTLVPETVAVYKGGLDTDKNIVGWGTEAGQTDAVKVYPEKTRKTDNSGYDTNPNYDPNVVVSYDDNTRRLQIFIPDAQAYVVEFNVIPSANGKYTNTAVLRVDTLTFEDTDTRNFSVDSSATIADTGNKFSLLKLDLYNLGQTLPDAEFKLYEAVLDENKKITGKTQLPNESKVFTSDVNGKVSFDGVAFEEGKLYFWEETKAPADHLLVDTSYHYFCVYTEYVHKDDKHLDTQITTGIKWTDLDVAFEGRTAELTTLREDIAQALGKDPYNPGSETFTLQQINDSTIDSAKKTTIFQNLAKQLTGVSKAGAEDLDHKAQDANHIIVMSERGDYTWSWRNPRKTAYAELGGNKLYAGHELSGGEYSFTLYEKAGTQEVRTQKVVNDANGNFTFSGLAYKEPGTYTYVIREDLPNNATEEQKKQPYTVIDGIVYDNVPCEVEVRVTAQDIHRGEDDTNGYRIPDSQITYRKNGEILNVGTSSLFDNADDKASIIINKTFSGDYKLTTNEKNAISFTIKDKETGALIANVSYKDMRAGHYTQTEGITAGREYLVTENVTDIDGITRTTTYIVKGQEKQGGTEATVPVPADDHAAQVDFDNHYEPDHMQLRVVKRWYTEKDYYKDETNKEYSAKHMLPIPTEEAPDNVSEVYFKLQRYIGPDTDMTDENWSDTDQDHWVWVDDKFEIDANVQSTREANFQDRTYYFSNFYTLKANMNWARTLGEDGSMPIGRYRVVEIEKNGVDADKGQKWKIVSHGNVVYKNNSEFTVGVEVPIPYGDNGLMADKERFSKDNGIDGKDNPENGVIYTYNRSYEIDFTKHWYKDETSYQADLDAQTITTGEDNKVTGKNKPRDNAVNDLSALGVKSVTLMLQSATLKNGADGSREEDFNPWSPSVEDYNNGAQCRTKTITGASAQGSKVTFNGIARKDADGNFLYYRVVEVAMELTDGTKLNADQIAKRFDFRYEPTPRKVGSGNEARMDYDNPNAHMKPADGADYGKQDVDNVKKPYGIEVTKVWDLPAPEETPQSVYVRLYVDYGNYSSYKDDQTLKTDAGQGPVVYNGMCLYEIKYDTVTNKYIPISFSDLFRKSTDWQGITTLMPAPTGGEKAVRFVEYRKVGENSYQEFADNAHQVKSTFTDADGKTSSVMSGVSPMAAGTYTMTNVPRNSTELKVTKAWPGRPADQERIYYQLHIVAEDGTDMILKKNDGNNINSDIPEKKIRFKENSDSIFYLAYNSADSSWDTADFIFPQGMMKINWADKYAAGFYVVETDENGTPLQSTAEQRISYSWTDDTETREGVGKDKLAPSGTTGILTITNRKPEGVQPSVKKLWKTGDADATNTWPDSVKQITVQLLKSENLGVTLIPVDEPKVISASTPGHTITWDKQPEESGVTYYVREVSVTYMENGREQTASGTNRKNWFVGDSAIHDDYVIALTENEGELDIGQLTNKTPPEEPPTTLYVTKLWTDEDNNLRPPADGETITLRLMSLTASGAAEPYEVPKANLKNGLTLRNNSAEKDTELVLTASNGSWPIGQIQGLPRYRGGEAVEYYLREIAAADENGKIKYYHASYTVNGVESDDPTNSASTGGPDNLITVHNTPAKRSISVRKVWDDTYIHPLETATMQLYRWIGDTAVAPVEDGRDPIGDVDTMHLTIDVDEATLPPGDWAVTFWDLKDENNNTLIVRDHAITFSNSEHSAKAYILPANNGDSTIRYSCVYAANFDSRYTCKLVASVGDHSWDISNGENGNTRLQMPAGSGNVTITLRFEGPAEGPVGSADNGLFGLLSDMDTFDAGDGQATLKTIYVSKLPDPPPDDATIVPFTQEEIDTYHINPTVILNRDGNGLTYTWDELPEDDGQGHTYHYAVAERELSYTIADGNEVKYVYYYTDGTVSETLDNNKDVREVEVKNKPTYPSWSSAKVKIIKLDSGDLDAELAKVRGLEGAVFRLERAENGAAYQIMQEGLTTNAHGELTIDNLGPYNYRLVETMAPPGYLISSEPFYFSFTDRGELNYTPSRLIKAETGELEGTKLTGIFRIGNAPGVELPATGGTGAGAYRIGGAALLLAATGLAAAEPLKRSRADRARRRKGGEGET